MKRLPRRVLIVTSAFPPTMLADMQRARLLAYDLPDVGWKVEVLTPSAAFQRPIWVEPESDVLLPANVPVHEVSLCWEGVFRIFGVTSVGWRVFWPMYRLGCRVLENGSYDLIYVTTTQFVLFCLGRLWWRKFGVPYILDFHDPWYRKNQGYVTTPQGLKFWISSRLSKSMERFALRRAAGLVAVSTIYLEQLERRYPKLTSVRRQRRAVIPFSATKRDFEAARTVGVAEKPAESDGRILEVVYVGAGGSIMAKSFRCVAQALARLCKNDRELIGKVRIRLFGTYAYWMRGDPKDMEAIAKDEGIGDLVEEQPARVSYLRAMDLILRARGVLILGVDDPAYVPSKLFTYALTGKPLLACLHPDSQANRYFREMPGLGQLIHFDAETTRKSADDGEVRVFLAKMAAARTFDRTAEIAPYLSPAAAQRHAELFETSLS